MLRLPEAERLRAVQNLRLAEQLGAETVTLRGRRIAAEIVDFARRRQITRILAGQADRRSRWRAAVLRSPVDELVRLVARSRYGRSRRMAAPAAAAPVAAEKPPLVRVRRGSALSYPGHWPRLFDVSLLRPRPTSSWCICWRCWSPPCSAGRGPAILNSFLSVLAFDFCFVPPRWTFTVEEAKYVVTFAVMFLVAVVISHLTSLIRRQAEAARLQERQTAAMHALSRQLASTRGVEKILQVAVKHISEIFECQVVALLPDDQGKLRPAAGDLSAVFHKDILKELGVAQRAYESGQMAGWGTQNHAGVPDPLRSPAGGPRRLGSFGLAAPGPRSRNSGCCRSNCA